ncbi:hypothetical protein FN846DRAFT_926280 [Sphaerosporella brunnea]|uniref:Ipa protein n=1 Tax=Sphaerosporella brunnea TaxID=1250544 RepID=A0A5J5FBS0_9PEZI|nr:hypothetical protein FN846DRAFT_926280 [Sphaerosporella brunnea]
MNRASSSPPGVHGFAVIVAWRELAKRHARDKDAIAATWRAMGPEERESMLLEAVLGGDLPRHANDRPGNFNAFLTPEMNVKNLITGDNLLDMMWMRATTPIHDAYVADINLVREAARKYNFEPVAGNGVYQFLDEENWGRLLEIATHAPRNVRQNLLDMGKGYAMVTEADGKLVLERQWKIYPYLQILADDIMEHKRKLENPGAGPVKRKAADKATVVQSLQQLDLDKKGSDRKEKQKPKNKTTVQDVRSIASEQYKTIDDHLHLLREEPQYLANIAGQHYFFSAPDVAIPDEHGRPDSAQMMTGAYCNRVIKEAFGDTFEAYGNWKTINTLLSALEEKPVSDSPITKELWSLCSRELTRARLLFKRMLQADHKISTYFVRHGSSVHLKAPLVIRGKKDRHLELLIGIARMDASDPDPDVAIAEALKEIHQLEEEVPKFRENINDQVGAALGDVAVITALMVKLRSLVAIPKQPTVVFVKSLQERMSRLKEAWESVERDDYASPVSKLKDPGMAEAYYGILADECVKRLNVRLDRLFDDCIETALCRTIETMETMELQSLNRRCQIPWDPFVDAVGEKKPLPDSSAEKREKIKTRGTPAAEYLVQQNHLPSKKVNPTATEKIPISSNAAKTLKKLFSPAASQSSSGVPWSAFLAAMTNLGFSTEPLWGSVVRFKKTESEVINIHRPHPGDRFEGFSASRLRARLMRRFGWCAESFVVEKKKKQ